MTMEIGSLLNARYRITEVLGQGGMAAVYRAIDENLGVEVAVKENLFTTGEYARQFRLEATILANLRHPHLPRVSDHFVIEQQGQYLVMDFIEGEDLRQRMDRIGPLPEQEAIVIGVAISDALAYLHSRDPMVLHRDIKPGNVRITPQGHIFLVDFGLAKIVQGREVTDSGARAMTPGYSPPEQYGTARTDHRSDIYSLGATLYSALTDHLPEDGLSRAMDQTGLTPISSLTHRVGTRLAEVIERCLEVRPDRRYQSAEELRRDLLEARNTSQRRGPISLVLPPPPIMLASTTHGVEGGEAAQNEANPASGEAASGTASGDKDIRLRKQTIKPPYWLTLSVLFTVLGVLAILVINPGSRSQLLGSFRAATPTITRATQENIQISVTPVGLAPTNGMGEAQVETPSPSPEPSPTGTAVPTVVRTQSPQPTLIGGGLSQILFASDRSGSPEIYLVLVKGLLVTQLTNIAEGACQPDWSPDGKKIVFVSPCPKDQVIYAGASLFIMNSDGSDLTPLPSVPGGDYDPSWSPDGKQLAFTSLRDRGVPKIFLMSLEDFSVSLLGEEGDKTSSQPTWSPDGERIAFVGSDNRIWSINMATRERHGLTRGGGDFVSSEPAWSPDGSTVVFVRRRVSDTTATNWLMAVPYSEEGGLAMSIPNADLISKVSYSPDGFWLAYKSWAADNHDIYIMRPSGVDKQLVVSDPAYDFDPIWRPYVAIP